MPPERGTLGALLRDHAATRPDATALVFENRETSYAALDREADAIGAALRAQAFANGGRVAYHGRNTDRLLALLFGCARAGAVLVPINWRLAQAEVDQVIADSQARLLFVTREHAAGADAALPVVIVDDDTAWAEWLRATDTVAVSADPATVVLQIYSSGTTGRAKGVELTHANLLSSFAQTGSGMLGDWTAEDRMLVALPMFHIAALLCAGFALGVGACCVVLRDVDLPTMQAAAARRRVTKAGLVPTLIQLLIDWPEFDARAWASLNLLIYGGSGIAPALLARARPALGCDLVQLYGASETAALATALSPADHRDARPERLGSCGRALPGVAIRIIGATDESLAVDESGEVLVRSPSVMAGYWRRPEESAKALAGGWYRTGDIGSLDADGYLTIRDRIRDMIISGGENVYALEVENVLASHPAVAGCAVIGTSDPLWGEAVTAVVMARAGVAIDATDLVAHARQRIAAYKCPRRVEFLDALPLNASGKIDKPLLRARFGKV